MKVRFIGDYAVQQCATCLAFDDGKCRRNPPVMGDVGMGVWPVVHSDDWCGQWSDRRSNMEKPA